MTDQQLLTECKKSLGIQEESTAFDGVLNQKLLAVKSYIKGAGATDEMMTDDLAVGVIVMGVGDIWNQGGGEIKFSTAFHTLLSQLVLRGNILTVSSNPADGAVDVAVSTKPVLTFNRRIETFKARLVKYDSKDTVFFTSETDITGKIVTLTPASDLEAATKYAIALDKAAAYSGQSLPYTVLSFTTV